MVGPYTNKIFIGVQNLGGSRVFMEKYPKAGEWGHNGKKKRKNLTNNKIRCFISNAEDILSDGANTKYKQSLEKMSLYMQKISVDLGECHA